MLTRITIRNFKRFDEAVIELGNPVVFIGPNDSGKTTALQALALWDVGVRRWSEKRSGKPTALKRVGVAVNRRDLMAVPVPTANLLWHDLHVREVHRNGGKPDTKNIRISVVVEGVSSGKVWECGLEFDYANEESLYCRPLSLTTGTRMEVPAEATEIHVAFLPPMSGLAPRENRLDEGAIRVHLGEGRTAEVLRNLCYQVYLRNEEGGRWRNVCERMKRLFGITLLEPTYIQERGEVAVSYQNADGIRLDLSSAGRGLQQTLLLLTHMIANPKTVLLLDEPDAHLEILRQRQTYQLLVDTAKEHGSQIIAASHSEVVLQEAADRDVVIAFVGKPHRIDDRGSQALKSLREIGFDQYYQAEQAGWVLYLEGATDLAILQSFARKLKHRAESVLDRPFVHYVGNQPSKAKGHFEGLREAKNDLVGFALFDRIDKELVEHPSLDQHKLTRREIENYLCLPDVLVAYAKNSGEESAPGPLFSGGEALKREQIMRECIHDLVSPLALRDPADPWWRDAKASDDFLDRLFPLYFGKLGLPNLMQKTDYHTLAQFVPVGLIDNEITEVLDKLSDAASKAHGG